MKEKKPTPAKPITLANQAKMLKHWFPASRSRVERGKLTWFGEIQPTPLSRKYRVELTIEGNEYRFYIINASDIICDLGEISSEHQRIYWHRGMFVLHAIIPIMSYWLFCAEIYECTGEWKGRANFTV